MVLLVGAGPMAVDHSKVLDALDIEYTVIGRGQNSANQFKSETGHSVITGGLDSYTEIGRAFPEQAIVSVGVEQLAPVTISLLKNGVKEILLEKPAGLNFSEIRQVGEMAKEQNAKIYVAYNRRFFSSVIKATEIIKEDGGVENFTFELTEWGHTIEPLKKAEGVKENWFLGNTSHVADLAFYLGGAVKNINCYNTGKTKWHERSAIFVGAGETEDGALFSYHGNWNAPGRWSVEMITRNFRLILRPLEKLQIQNIGTVQIVECDIEDDLDVKFKPGLYKQLKGFITGNTQNHCTIEEHIRNCSVYLEMANYSP